MANTRQFNHTTPFFWTESQLRNEGNTQSLSKSSRRKYHSERLQKRKYDWFGRQQSRAGEQNPRGRSQKTNKVPDLRLSSILTEHSCYQMHLQVQQNETYTLLMQVCSIQCFALPISSVYITFCLSSGHPRLCAYCTM